MRTRLLAITAIAVLGTISLAACGSDDDSDSTASSSTAPSSSSASDATTGSTDSTDDASGETTIVFNGQGNDLAAYAAEPPFTKQIVIHHRDDEHPDGLDINAEICFDPANPRRFVAGEDTLQSTTGEPGWGIFELSGDGIGDFGARQVGKLITTFQPSNDNPENYGCGFLPDGRIVTTDVGNQAAGDGDGQLIVWFGPFESREVAHCKVNVGLTTGQGMLVDGDHVYFTQARPPAAGVYRYAIADLPTSATPEGGCDGTDATGAPLATGLEAERFITAGDGNTLATPNDIAKGPDGHLYVSSVFNGVIAEFDAEGTYVRDVLAPPAGEALGAEPFSTGTPLGLGVAPDGSVFFADIGIVATAEGIGPGDGTGTVRRIAFAADGTPRPPEMMDTGLAFPDGIGLFTCC